MPNTSPSELLFYCRPGFETDLVNELVDKFEHSECAWHPVATPQSGYVRMVIDNDLVANDVHKEVQLSSLVFARQMLVAFEPIVLDRNDRITAIIDQIVAAGWSFEELWQESPDTNDGKGLAGLKKSLQRPLESTLKKRQALRRKAGKRRLHLFWSSGDTVQVAMSFPQNRSEWPNGIKHLRSPSRAPSRSTLKLEEAWHTFIPSDKWERRLNAGMQGADLGAAPGGWTYQLVQQGMYVYAIDNGPMSEELMRTGQIEHLREDGFTWSPPYPLDWLVCDIVDRPIRVSEMVERWLVNRWCRHAIFNLKLPMKKRWQEVKRCLEYLEQRLSDENIEHECLARHLYHDREEITVYIRLKE
ncbi:23S rRNA (cytidine(2498)-2'-O)-methyltransferase RlmM [Larsenimonas suaedae]|uniref:Ribosomal RNA large subunit methyltransferase M n=1 Tax=Larsenimonas suaedae TaxID=1851019 RepID=A0ABU1GUC1_9GAMM|nr:23S rRNA (cytidine(2498)-2'-O)-methyltransferase RlmM [Larsenimonas suaedae]MCM2970899.1 23S rRNA (cytidine(2498)-2'-O)-methyltransferase RlmM [Larsenimonas suaedae]MDR5895608.1 23S rRNA (cytidine(2498)-2'-O)-methyltransferase RlmM [Larsenimonas suaedae]